VVQELCIHILNYAYTIAYLRVGIY
jgi:hypothetical protein